MGTVFLQHCLRSHLIMLLLTALALLASGCLAELVLPRGHVMAGRMPYNSPFFHYNGFHNGMINHHLLRSSHHVADPRFSMVNTLPFRAGHPIAPTMGPIMGHPFHALPLQPYTSAHNMVPIATAVHDPTYVSKNGEVEHVVKGIHAETAIKNIHGVTKREAEPMVDGVHARTAVNTMPITTGMISPTMGHAIANVYSGYPMTHGIQHRPHHDSLHAPPLPCWPAYGVDNCSQLTHWYPWHQHWNSWHHFWPPWHHHWPPWFSKNGLVRESVLSLDG